MIKKYVTSDLAPWDLRREIRTSDKNRKHLHSPVPRPPLEQSPSTLRPTDLWWPTTQEFQQAIQQVLECYVIESQTFTDMTSGP